jgi:hypothetical protein
LKEKLDLSELGMREIDPMLLDKNELLRDIDEISREEKGLGFKNVMLGVVGMVTAVMIVFPKIYINSNIYYLSLEINTLYSNAKSLSEEQRFLKQKLEGVKYQQDIINELR